MNRLQPKHNHLYFVRLFKQNKLLFAAVVIFFALQINANFFVGGQQSPFYRWDLYAGPIPAYPEYSFYETDYNNGKKLLFPATWQQSKRLLYLNALNEYMFMVRNNGRVPSSEYIDNWNASHPAMADHFKGLKFYPDSVEMKRFPGWYVHAIGKYTGEKITSLTIYEVIVKFDEDGSVKLLSRKPVCKLK